MVEKSGSITQLNPFALIRLIRVRNLSLIRVSPLHPR